MASAIAAFCRGVNAPPPSGVPGRRDITTVGWPASYVRRSGLVARDGHAVANDFNASRSRSDSPRCHEVNRLNASTREVFERDLASAVASDAGALLGTTLAASVIVTGAPCRGYRKLNP
jgi:hypothetical protein